ECFLNTTSKKSPRSGWREMLDRYARERPVSDYSVRANCLTALIQFERFNFALSFTRSERSGEFRRESGSTELRLVCWQRPASCQHPQPSTTPYPLDESASSFAQASRTQSRTHRCAGSASTRGCHSSETVNSGVGTGT